MATMAPPGLRSAMGWTVGVVVSRAGLAAGLLAAPLVGLPAANLPAFMGHAFSQSPAAVAAGWAVFLAVGVGWVWVFSRLRLSLPVWAAALTTAALNWSTCVFVVLPTARLWGPRVAAGALLAPGWLGLRWSPLLPWTLALAFALSAPGLWLCALDRRVPAP